MSGDQLRLPLLDAPAPSLPYRVAPMQATPVDAPFDDPDYFFEPWWPGVRALAFIEPRSLRLQVTGLSDPLAVFPELAELAAQVRDDGLILDGTLMVLDDQGRPDADLLRRRLEADDDLLRTGSPAYVASDLLWSDGASWMRRPFRARRDRLTSVLPSGDRVIAGRGYVREGTLVAEALAALGIDGLSARRLSARYRSGDAGDAWVRASLVPARPSARPTLALILRLPLELG